MPMDRSRYPADWRAISAAIRERAGNRCEWCGVVNGAIGARDRDGNWHDETDIDRMNSGVGDALFGEYPRLIRIVLTVAHLGTPHPDGRPGDKRDKHDVRPENMAAVCQRCHLTFDRADHVARRRETLARRRLEAVAATGQLELLS